MTDLSVLGGLLGNARRDGHTEEAARLERELATEQIVRFIKKTMDDAPRLTDEQIGRIARTLGGAR